MKKKLAALVLAAAIVLGLVAAPAAAHGSCSATGNVYWHYGNLQVKMVNARGTGTCTYAHDEMVLTVTMQEYRDGAWRPLNTQDGFSTNSKTVKAGEGFLYSVRCVSGRSYRAKVSLYVEDNGVHVHTANFTGNGQVLC